MRAKFAGGASALDDEDGPPKTADSEYTDAGDLVSLGAGSWIMPHRRQAHTPSAHIQKKIHTGRYM